jgi:hypothetical protein
MIGATLDPSSVDQVPARATDRNFVTSDGGGTINMASSSTVMTLTGLARANFVIIADVGSHRINH